MTQVHTYCSMSKSRCGIIAEVEDGVLRKVKVDPDHPNGRILCIKGVALPQLVYSPQRLKYPMKRTRHKGDPDPGWVRISWEEALEAIAQEMNRIKATYGPEAIFFYRSAPGGSPAADYDGWVSRLAHAFGSPNKVTTGYICNWHKDDGSKYTYGNGIPDPDFQNSRYVVLWGHNPHTSWISHVRDIEDALDKGAELIVVDPHRIPLVGKSKLFLQVRPGSDGALALGMIATMMEEGLYNEHFAMDWTNGPFLVRIADGKLLTEADCCSGGDAARYLVWDQANHEARPFDPRTSLCCDVAHEPDLYFRGSVPGPGGESWECATAFALLRDLAQQHRPEAMESVTWLEAGQVREATRLMCSAPTSYYTYNGVEQHTNAMQTNRALCILYTLTGWYDAPGGNVRFPRPKTNPITGGEFLPKEVALRRLGRAQRPLGPASGPSVRAVDVFDAALTGVPYPLRGGVSFGGNIITSTADSIKGREALKSLDLFVQVDLFQSPAADLADIVLPASTFIEGAALRTTFEQAPPMCTHMQYRPAVIQPLYDSRPDTEIVFALAVKLGLGDKFWNGDIEAAFRYQLEPSGVTLEGLKSNPIGVTLPLEVEHRKYARRKADGSIEGFNTPTRRVEIYSQTFKDHGYDPLPVYRESAQGPLARPDLAKMYPLTLFAAKTQYYCHGQHRAVPLLRKAVPDPFVEIHPLKARELGIADGQWVRIESEVGAMTAVAKVTDKVRPETATTQHGWWQSCDELGKAGYDVYSPEGANLNLLYSTEVCDPISGSLPYKSSLCRIVPLGAGSTRVCS